jgi:DNA mismatch repair protein MutS2
MSKEVAHIEDRVLTKLEWPLVTDHLARLAQTTEGRAACQTLSPTLGRVEIEDRWRLSLPLRRLVQQGYRAPIGELEPMHPILKAAGMGQVLDGVDIRQVGTLLEATRKVHAFASDLQSRCETLAKIRPLILSLPQLLAEINRTVGAEGELLDTASPELTRIRRQKISVRKRIEDTIKRLIHDNAELGKYLQDDFYTVRSERYVIPMRVDGRGRVKGSILDTSASGQTLFLEPAAITPINDELQDLEIEEKLEIARIFRDLTAKIAKDRDTLAGNYDQLLRLDCLTAEADLAARLNAGTVTLADRPLLDLRGARHPLIGNHDGHKGAVANTVGLESTQTSLIVSGPNAGGKTVVLKTVGLVHLMAKAGLLVPADETSQLYLFDHVYLEMGDSQNLTANLSTFSGHLLGLKPILNDADEHDLVLLDELAVGTDPQTGAAIATAVLEDLADRKAMTLVTTHFDALKGMAIKDKRFRNGSMEFSLASLKPTYQLILDVPGQSYGIEVAEQMGLPARLIARAKDLRGHAASALDQAVSDLMHARDAARQMQEETHKAKLAAEAEQERWRQEVELVKEQRKKAAKHLTDKYEDDLRQLRGEFEDAIKKLRQAAKDSKGDTQASLADRRVADESLKKMDNVLGELASSFNDEKLPGRVTTRAELSPGTPVYVLPLKKAGRVVKVPMGDSEPIDVEVGVIKLRVSTHDLRLISEGEVAGGKPAPAKHDKPKPPSAPNKPAAGASPEVPFTPQTATNSIDLRGKDVDDAIKSSLDFLDRSLMRGEESVILIHGHGTGALQANLRHALKHSCPYDVRFRAGIDQEGGDGVTVVKFVT